MAFLGPASCARDTLKSPIDTPSGIPTANGDVLAEQHEPKASSRSSAEATVQISLQANVNGIDGREFWLGVRLHPPEGTHLYWQNPGETGLATTAEFRAPAQYQLSAVKYPGPVRLPSERGATTYGYVNDAVLLVRVSPLAQTQEATFRVFGSWLSCGLVCVRETGEAELTLGVADEITETHSLDPFIAALPQPGDDIVVNWTSSNEVLLSHPEFRLVEYFPVAPFGFEDRAPLVTARADGSLQVKLNRQTLPDPLVAVIAAEHDAQRLYFELTLVPKTF